MYMHKNNLRLTQREAPHRTNANERNRTPVAPSARSLPRLQPSTLNLEPRVTRTGVRTNPHPAVLRHQTLHPAQSESQPQSQSLRAQTSETMFNPGPKTCNSNPPSFSAPGRKHRVVTQPGAKCATNSLVNRVCVCVCFCGLL